MELLSRLLLICLLRYAVSGWDNRDYGEDDLADDDTVPEDWKSRIDPTTMDERLSERSTVNLLADDIVYADDDHSGPNGTTRKGKQGHLLKLWHSGKVPFQISPLFEASSKFIIEEAMRLIVTATTGCISFRPRTSEQNFVLFQPGDNCSSHIGVVGGEQKLTLKEPGCLVLGIVKHEILHALGFYHEHARPDRDEYVRVHLSNVREEAITNFQKNELMPTFDVGYDIESIMHYGVFDFSISPEKDHPVILPLHGKNHTMGQRTGLSVRDVTKLRNAYNCPVDHDDDIADKMFRTPKFSGEPTSHEQCSLQFNAYCRTVLILTTNESCTKYNALDISCTWDATAEHLQSMASAMAKPPLRPVFLVNYGTDGLIMGLPT